MEGILVRFCVTHNQRQTDCEFTLLAGYRLQNNLAQQTSKPANQQTSKPANQQTSKPANQQTSKPANQQTSKRSVIAIASYILCSARYE